jgi:hypothetical protein
MKPLSRFLVSAALFVALFGSAQAQLETYQTVQPDPNKGTPGYNGSVDSFDGFDVVAQGQLFSNVLAIESMTYNLFTTGTPAETVLLATFGQWDTTTNSFVGPTLEWEKSILTSGWNTLAIGANSYTTFTLDLNLVEKHGSLYITDPSLTYAMILSQVTPGNLDFGIGKTTNAAFGYGYGIQIDDSGGATTLNRDFTFSQISLVPNEEGYQLPPVPEASTVAAMIGAAFIAALVGLRLRQRRQLAAVPVGSIAA